MVNEREGRGWMQRVCHNRLPGGPRERGWWCKSEQTAANVLCFCQALESGRVDEAGSAGGGGVQLRAPELGWETPAESNHTWQSLAILRSEPKSSGAEAKLTFLPTKGLRDSFLEEMAP